ncbi:MAG: hypothetical protein Q9168_002295 [Polycauliona sp. 1 TL-2023]
MPKSKERRKRCGIDNCPSTRFHLEDGLLFCGEGHQQEQGPETQSEADLEFGAQGRKSRAKREETQGKASKVYRGSEALALFLKAYQHILQKQSYVLIHTFGLPAKFEEVLRNRLWAPRLQLLTDRLEIFDDDTVFSSQANSESESEVKKGLHGRARERKSRSKLVPSLMDSLGMCYLGMIMLRLPISLSDLHRYQGQRLPKLQRKHVRGLQVKSVIKADDLRKNVHELSLFYYQHFNETFPALNHPLVLFKHVHGLALPLDVFPAVRRIAKLLDIDFTFPKTRPRQRITSLPEVALIALLVIAVKLYYPFDPIDRHPRSAVESGALAVDWDQWCKAQTEYDSRETANGQLGRGNEIKVEEKDVFNLSGAQMDEYLDWFEKTWVDEERARSHPRGYPEQLLDMFPTKREDARPTRKTIEEENQADDEALKRKLKTVQGHLKARKIISDRDARESRVPINRIGSSYKRYRKIEDLSDTARRFHETAAGLAAMKLSSLLVAVLQIEQKLIRLRKRDLEAGAVDDNASGNQEESKDDSNSDQTSDGSEPSMDLDTTSSEDGDVNGARVTRSVGARNHSDSLYADEESP